MAAKVKQHKAILSIDEWPAEDRALWAAGTAPPVWLAKPKHAHNLRPHSVRNAARGWGRFLGFLTEVGRLNPDLKPAARLTVEVADEFVAHLARVGNSDNTINARMLEIRAALRIMQPETDRALAWLTSPGGVSLRQLLPASLRPRREYDLDELRAWAAEKMEAARPKLPGKSALTEFRNGLLIALFATRSPRINAMANLILGQDIYRAGQNYRIILRGEVAKNYRTLEFDSPNEVTPFIDDYLTLVRPVLCPNGAHDWFWVTEDGARLKIRAIESVIRRAFCAQFGKSDGPHAFRRTLLTANAENDPQNHGSGAALLGIGIDVAEEHYDRARGRQAAAKFQAHVQKRRHETAHLVMEKDFDDSKI